MPFGDTDAFVAAVLALLLDPKLLAGFSERAQRAVQRFSFDGHVRQLLDCYQELAPSSDVVARQSS